MTGSETEEGSAPFSNPPRQRKLARVSGWVIGPLGVLGIFVFAPYAGESVETLQWEFRNVRAQWAAAAGVLFAVAIAMFVVSRRLEAEPRRELASVMGWIFFVPALFWTLFLLGMTGSGGSEELTVGELIPDWAGLGVPLFAATVGLFALGRWWR